MKKIFGLFFCITLFACDDGDIIVEDLSFQDIDVEACLPDDTSESGTYLFYKSDDSTFESLSIELTSTTNFFDTDGSNPSFTIGSNNSVEYRKYDGATGDDYFCSLLPPTSPNVIDALISSSGQVNLTVSNQVLTSTAALNNEEEEGLDSDDDGIPNYLEPSGQDTDGDGLPDKIDADDDGDNVPTSEEGVTIDDDGTISPLSRDSDEDGIPDYLDNDDDNDGILTIQEDADSDLDPTNDIANETINPLPDYRNDLVSNAVSPAIDNFIEHSYRRIAVIEISIPVLTLVRGEETVVFENFEQIENFGTYVRPAYQVTLTPVFAEPQ
ncbi:hypothetical protein SAMN05192588_0165 [Nonlabens sp. Hel1_33_55]|uniref:hypothetical protein n=1 Tax=Nonlabens sp. Hel1_33_55 TaxID=1336802 RepID=UPI000875E621|nr:hypothetical protein [Nonlabens sp. Hel1_33_55]SCX89863.1 hypothetical protein SAMN05192588_0165 [Nonlabens sp. Hel1_33_55]